MIRPKSYICQGHSWSSQNKALSWSVVIRFPLGKHSGLQSRAAWGLVFTGESSTSHRLFKIPRERLHIAWGTIFFLNSNPLFPCGHLSGTLFFQRPWKTQVARVSTNCKKEQWTISSPFYINSNNDFMFPLDLIDKRDKKGSWTLGRKFKLNSANLFNLPFL